MNVYVPHKDTERFLSIVQSVLLERLRREDHMWLLCGCLCPVRASQCREFSFCIRLRENRYTGAGTRLDHCHFQRKKDIPAKATALDWCSCPFYKHFRPVSSPLRWGSSPHCSYFPHYCLNLKMKLPRDSSVLYLWVSWASVFIVKESRRKVLCQGKGSFKMKTVS